MMRGFADAAYFCLTLAERDAGGRPAAAQLYAIDGKVLRKLGDLTANKGGHDARKADGAGTDFTAAELNWLEAAMKMLIRRASQRAHEPGAVLPKITMADLPAP